MYREVQGVDCLISGDVDFDQMVLWAMQFGHCEVTVFIAMLL